jgi:hypothetical protein
MLSAIEEEMGCRVVFLITLFYAYALVSLNFQLVSSHI